MYENSTPNAWTSAATTPLDGHIAPSREQAMREVAPHYEENMKMFGELRLVRALTGEQIAAMRDPRGWRGP